MTTFETFGLHKKILQSLDEMGYSTPTEIQEKSIPHVLEGKDILGSAQTGTGKTGAFILPIVHKLLETTRGSALVLSPTRELARQIHEMVKGVLGHKSVFSTVLLIGGEPMGPQIAALRRSPRLIIATPGRVNDHLERGSLMLHDANILVLDETDRMLDLGFGIQINQILKFMPAQKQTLLFSATLSPSIIKLSEKYLNDPVRVAVGEANALAENLNQEILYVTEDKKYQELIDQLSKREGSVIIFVKTKYATEKIADRLSDDGFEADAIHGDLRQNKRDRVLKGFRNERYRILVATDVAARGLDVPHIEHVINYDLPQLPEDYIHRVGRTARAGAEGHAVCFISPQERGKWHAIECLLDPSKRSARHPSSSKEKRSSDRGGRKRSDKRDYSDGASRFKGERDGASRFKGERDGASRFKGERDGASRFKGERDGASRFKGERNGAPRQARGNKADSEGFRKPFQSGDAREGKPARASSKKEGFAGKSSHERDDRSSSSRRDFKGGVGKKRDFSKSDFPKSDFPKSDFPKSSGAKQSIGAKDGVKRGDAFKAKKARSTGRPDGSQGGFMKKIKRRDH